MRNKQLDFLRGIAVILVLLCHYSVNFNILKTGWIGVDLFFVLSGFLISGLLLREYERFGDVRPGLFLIRRGLKIYPLFYFSIVLTIILTLVVGMEQLDSLNTKGKIISTVIEVFFLQSYWLGYWGHHWSLAVEEHFYLLVVVLFPFFIKRPRLVLLIFPLELILRFVGQIYLPQRGFADSHLRMDSLAMGVCIAYVYHFHPRTLTRVYRRYKPLFIAVTFLPLLFIGDDQLTSFWVKTVGFSLLYLAFGSLLVIMLHTEVKFRGSGLVAWIGFYSYGIYLLHMYLVRFVVGESPSEWSSDIPIKFGVYFIGSILFGALMSWLIEKPFLRLRDKHWPRRTEEAGQELPQDMSQERTLASAAAAGA